MSTDATELIVPGHGTLFIADANTPVPANPLSVFTLAGDPPDGWDNIGHTSLDNPPAFKTDGGDATILGTWLADGVKTIYATKNWSLGFNPLQMAEESLDLAFGGSIDPTTGGYIIPASSDGIGKALFLLATDGTGALGFYIPNTSVALSDAPAIKVDGFFELPLSASILGAPSDVIPAATNGKPGIMELFKTGLTASNPLISSVTSTPSAQVEDGMIEIFGSGFTGTTGVAGVKIGGTNAPSYIVVDDGHIVAQMPAGSAGSVPIVVTSPIGASNSQAYTRGA